jgi:hypothetical protein
VSGTLLSIQHGENFINKLPRIKRQDVALKELISGSEEFPPDTEEFLKEIKLMR